MAQSQISSPVLYRSCEKTCRDLVGPRIKFELFSGSPSVKCFLFAELGDESYVGQKTLVKPACNFGEVIAFLILNDFVFQILEFS